MYRFDESAPCLICGKTDIRTLFRGEGQAQVVRCNNDGLIFLSPRPTAQYLREFHGHFVRRDNLELFDSYRKDILRREARAIKELKSGGNLLDVGCATGTFFENFQTTAWSLFGVDPAGLGVAQARSKYGADVFCGTLREAQYPSDFFDVVTLLDTIYYAPDPKAELAEIKRILKRDGVLAVEIPGLNYTLLRERGPICWLMDRKWSRGLAHSLHLFYFSPNTIRAVLERAGFGVIKTMPEQASLGGGRVRHLLNDVHFGLARLIFRSTGGKISIAGKEFYLAAKTSDVSSLSDLLVRRNGGKKIEEAKNASVALRAWVHAR